MLRVPCLALPAPHPLLLEGPRMPAIPTDLVSAWMQSDAVRLVVDRTTAAMASFKLTDQNAFAVVDVCRRLDGNPLAIELAAARVRVLTVKQIAERLNDRFHLLASGSRTTMPHRQTLKATMDWSYDLLSEPERILFRRLSVFIGGRTLEATEAVCAAGDLVPQPLSLKGLC